MAAMKKTAVSIEKALYDRVESLARQRKVSRSRLFGLAMENYLRGVQGLPDDAQVAGEEPPAVADRAGPPAPLRGERGTIQQGDIYWVLPAESEDTEAGVLHPHVVIQEDVLNRSRIHSVVVCALTSNLKRAKAPGNVLLDAGEGSLPRQSVVEVSKVSALEKTRLGEYIGSLSRGRVEQILAGLEFVAFFTEPRHNWVEPEEDEDA